MTALAAAAPALAQDPTANAFVAVELPAPSAWSAISSGVVLDVNNDGWACGRTDNGGGNGLQPFVFDPAVTTSAPRGTTTLLPYDSQTYSGGEATAMLDGANPIIVGTVWTSGGHTEACYWTSNAGSWSMTEIFASGTIPSEATGVAVVGSDTIITGQQKSLNGNTQWRSFQLELGVGTIFCPGGDENWSWDVSTTGVSVGGRELVADPTHLKAFHWNPSSGTSNVHPGAYVASEALAVNVWTSGQTTYSDLAGWAEDSNGAIKAAFWRETGTPSILVFAPLNIESGQSYANDLNDSREVVGTVFDAQSGLPVEAFAWSFNDNDPVGDNLSAITRFPVYHSGNLIKEARAINDDGWIAGSMKPNGASDATPCLLVPYDVDNNGTPDYREIINGSREDDGSTSGIPGNWIPDDFEGTRAGLYPGALDQTQREYQNGVEDLHSVRLHLDLATVYAINHEQLDPNGTPWDERWGCAVNGFGSGDDGDSGTADQGKEIVVMVRSSGHPQHSPSGSDREDHLPPIPINGTLNLSRADAAAEMAVFAHANAHCIDYVQLGNEWLGGPGGWWFRQSDLPGCDANDPNWQGGLIAVVPDGCYEEACAEVFGWFGELEEAALCASALAGRPLRFVTPAIHPGTIGAGLSGNPQGPFDPEDDPENRAALAMNCVIDFGNARGAAVDMHMHYDDRFLVDELKGIDYLVDPASQTPPGPWDAAQLATCLEWSPVPTQAWWTPNQPTVRTYFEPTQQDPGPGEDWDWLLGDPQDGWKANDFAGDLAMDELLADLVANGFLHACYGEFGQGPVPVNDNGTPNDPDDDYAEPDKFSFVVIRANRVKNGFIDLPEKWSNVIKTDLEDAADNHPLPLGWTPPHDGTEDCGCQ